MMNFERVGETDSSWIVGLATMSTALPPWRGIIHSYRASSPCRRPDERSACARVLDAAALPGPAPVVRDRRDVVDAQDLQAGGGQRPDGRLSAAARAPHDHVDPLHAVL